jgi:nucleoside-diphosphate-sugar epimerase
MKVALTGASGMVGRFVAADLLARGCRVRGLTRSGAVPPGVEPVTGDFNDPLAARALVLGADLLVHAAFAHAPGRYRGGEGDDPCRFVAVNLHGSLALLRLARRCGVGAAVVFSSRAVLDGCPPGRHGEETAPRPTTLYGRIKAALEAFVQADGRDWHIAALRPTGVYGVLSPVEDSKWLDLIRRARAGDLPTADRAGTEVNGRDLADAVWRLGTMAEARGRVYNCSDIVVRRSEVLRLAGIETRLEPVGPPAVTLDCAGLRRLGWSPGGRERLAETVAVLSAALPGPRCAGVAR